jgi:predicted glycogen debranching enzyme
MFGPQVCGTLTAGAAREWLVADGLGGYASGTVSGLRTRRYHALLVVSGEVPARRMVALASLDPVVHTPGGHHVRLATHEWASGAVEPEGHLLLETFELLDGAPRWRWRAGETVLQCDLAMRTGSPQVSVLYTLVAGPAVDLGVEPLCTWRDAHGERHAGDLPVEATADGVLVADAYRVSGPGFTLDPQWYLGVYHREEAARGLAPTEDLLRVGHFRARLEPGQRVGISAWAASAEAPPPAAQVVDAYRARMRGLAAGATDPVEATLRQAADAFVVRGGAHGRSASSRAGAGIDVVAGYPWFGAWSRDTMIAYEGLFLATGRADEGRELLRAYAATLSEGMLANTSDTGRVEYNTADATLWLLHAVDRHLTATGDDDLAADLAGRLDDVLRHHIDGTRYGIRVDPSDGLLTQGLAPGPGQGPEGSTLTWMDAVVGGVAVTPRRGKAVELNALWINGLSAVTALRGRIGLDAAGLRPLLDRATASFRRAFPGPSGYLRDVVDPVGACLRPNQLLAYGLPYGPLRGVDDGAVRAVARTLLTPLGLRTLDPSDPAYRGAHRGDPSGRDTAYHQGTVWPWLIGPYADAARAVGLSTDGLLDGLVAHLSEWGVGSVSETADGDPPHDATGCPFQAWSVAELLRTWRS